LRRRRKKGLKREYEEVKKGWKRRGWKEGWWMERNGERQSGACEPLLACCAPRGRRCDDRREEEA